MVINNQFQENTVTKEVERLIVNPDGSTEAGTLPIVGEHFLDVFINTYPAARLVCTPANLVEMVVGRMVCEGYIKSAEEVEQIYICNTGNTVKVFLKEDIKFYPNNTEREATCCTENKILLKTENDAFKRLKKTDWKPEWVFALADEFKSESKIHRATQGTHSCYFSVNGKVMGSYEDIGRHNAMDKAIGHIVMQDMEREKCMLYTTGRVPTDMVKKVVAARIPVLVSKSVPTDAAIEMAKKYNLTLICKAWPDRYEIFNMAE